MKWFKGPTKQSDHVLEPCEESSKCGTFVILLWKNFAVQFRHQNRNFFEILIFMTFVLPLCMVLVPNRRLSTLTLFEINSLDYLRFSQNSQNGTPIWKLVYSPMNDVLETLMTSTIELLHLGGVVAVNNSAQIEQAMNAGNSNEILLAGIEFNHSSNLSELPANLDYNLRLPSELRFEHDNKKPYYYREGFLPIQHAIARAFIKQNRINGPDDDDLPEILMHQYPDIIDKFDTEWLGNLFGICLLVAFSVFIMNTVTHIVMEKERQLKDVLQIIGVSSSLYWASWCARTMIYLIVSSTIVVILLKINLHSDIFVLWVFLFVYTISMTTYCFMLSVILTEATIAGLVAVFIWLILYIPYVLSRTATTTLTTKWIACIFSNTAMAHGCRLIMEFENIKKGIQWSDFWASALAKDDLSLGITICYMLGSSLFYLIVALYVDKMLPNMFRKCCVPFCKKCCKNVTQTNSISSNPNFEAQPNRLAKITVKHLRKVYSNKTVAVDNLTMRIFSNQITILLGDNGAGKSSFISMLAGINAPTSGNIIVNGYDIQENLQKARQSMSFCPQQNIVYNELTVREHIQLFSRLKGMPKKEIEKEAIYYTKLMGMEQHIDKRVKYLSGVMKRKLSIAITLCGKSKVILCDEPTLGLVPPDRYAIWDLLQKEKKSRTILLTTSLMEDANIGDQIAIMVEGKLKCGGTPVFLKERFGSGRYRLVCDKDNECVPDAVVEVLRQFIPNIDIHDDTPNQLVYILPLEHVDKFEKLFERLEDKQQNLGISRFSVFSTPMEMVFGKIASNSMILLEERSSRSTKAPRIGPRVTPIVNYPDSSTISLLRGCRLYVNQWHAMFRKRFYCWLRSRSFFLLQILILIVSIMLTALLTDPEQFHPKREIDLSQYGETVTLLRYPTKSNDITNKTFKEYERIFKNSTATLNVVKNISIDEYFQGQAKNNFAEVYTQYLAGMSMSNASEIYAWFSFKATDPSAVSLNLVHNAMVKARLTSNHSIKVFDFPLPIREYPRVDYQRFQNIMYIEPMVIVLSNAISIVSSFYIIFYIRERVSKAKLLQISSGISLCIFWVASFLFDFATYMLTIFITIIILVVCHEQHWSTAEELAPVHFVLFTFGFSMLPLTYILSFLFSNTLIGFISIAALTILTKNLFAILMLQTPNEMARQFFLILPHYALYHSLENLNQEKQNVYTWSDPGIGRNLTYMLVSGVVFFAILFVIEYRVFSKTAHHVASLGKKVRKSKKDLPAADNTDDDSDVEEGKRKVDALTSADLHFSDLVLRKLSKFYGTQFSVNKISAAIKRAECFGILGSNGAGKTSILQMLVGDKAISSGDAFVQGFSLKTQISEVNKSIGYCPQFDALFEELTASQTLEIFASIRGIHSKDIRGLGELLANELDFKEELHERIGKLSKEHRKKIGIAVALIGNPLVILLDEPSVGLNPKNKTNLWRLLSKVCKSGKSILLSSRNVDECNALCTRLAVMINGEFKCIGPTQNLEDKFSDEILLIIKIKETVLVDAETQSDEVAKIKEAINQNLPDAVLNEEYQGHLEYLTPLAEMKWSWMFGFMESAKQTLSIEDYFISQVSLEHLFLAVMKYQR